MGAEVFLVHAEPAQTAVSQDEYDTKPEAMRLRRDALALEKAGVKVTSVFVEGPACDTILSEALRLKVDLIITGAHGHGGANCKASVGHISECILLRSKIPVMVVPV